MHAIIRVELFLKGGMYKFKFLGRKRKMSKIRNNFSLPFRPTTTTTTAAAMKKAMTTTTITTATTRRTTTKKILNKKRKMLPLLVQPLPIDKG